MRLLDVKAKRLRDNLEKRMVPRLKRSVAKVLDAQGAAAARAVEAHWDQIVARGATAAEPLYWDAAAQERKLAAALKPEQAGVIEAVVDHIGAAFDGR